MNEVAQQSKLDTQQDFTHIISVDQIHVYEKAIEWTGKRETIDGVEYIRFDPNAEGKIENVGKKGFAEGVLKIAFDPISIAEISNQQYLIRADEYTRYSQEKIATEITENTRIQLQKLNVANDDKY